MALITVSEIEKSFEQDRVILQGISFQVDAGERVAILGDNGAGKTTLLRILCGELQPDKGGVSVAKGSRIGYVRQINHEVTDRLVEDVLKDAYRVAIEKGKELEKLHDRMETVSAAKYDEVLRSFEAAGGYDWEAEYARIANGLNIPPEMRARRFDSLSGGEQTRVNLARMIMEKTDILLLDEPTNHLDVESMEWLEDYLLHYKGTVLVVSHDRYFLDTVAERIIEIRHGKTDFYSGNYSYYVQEKELRFQQQLLRYNQEQAKVKQLEFQIARLKAWGSVYDNPALHKKAAAMEKRIERVQQTDKPVKESRMQAGFSSEAFRADRVLTAEHLSKSFDGRSIIRDFSAFIRGGGERVALIGPNGVGKSTLLKMLLGILPPDEGTVKTGPSVRCAYLPQQVVFEHPERTLYDTMLYETGCSPQEARDRLGAFRFTGEDQFKTVSQLSGGERSRLRLCILMMSRVNFLVLDEPTNHLDLASREWIEEAVDAFEGTLLFVSHDRYFTRRFANHIWELGSGFTDYPDCDWDRYRRIKALKKQAEEKERAEIREKAAADRQKEKGKTAEKGVSSGRNPAQERKLKALEKEIEKQEALLAVFDEKMEEAASDYVLLQQLIGEKEELQAQIDEMYLKWEELSM